MSNVYLTLVCLSLCASCAAPAPRTVVLTEYVCHVRPEWMQPTPVPAPTAATVRDLDQETVDLQDALKACNVDKSKILNLTGKQKPPVASPGSTR